MYGVTYMWNLKYGTNKPIYKTEADSQTQTTDWLSEGEGKREGQTGSLRLVDAKHYI